MRVSSSNSPVLPVQNNKSEDIQQITRKANLSSSNVYFNGVNPASMLLVNRSKSQIAFGAGRIYNANDAKDPRATDKMIVGGKGAGLFEMKKLDMPVPSWYTITTDVCHEYEDLVKENDKAKMQEFSKDLMKDSMKSLVLIEDDMGRKFGDPKKPLLLSVRSGAPVSMPGMMDTILNVGLNDETVEGLVKETDNERFAYDSYRRLIQMFGSTVQGISSKAFETKLHDVKEKHKEEFNIKLLKGITTREELNKKLLSKGITNKELLDSEPLDKKLLTEELLKRKISDNELDPEHLKEVVREYKQLYKDNNKEFPQDVNKQLEMCIKTVFGSWMGAPAVNYRRINAIPAEYGTAVNVQAMVFGNMGDDSATGVAFTRHPKTGKDEIEIDFLINAQGEDVVAGIRKTYKADQLKENMPVAYEELTSILKRLEAHHNDMQDTEFTIQNGKLYMLQARNGKRTPAAAIQIAVDHVQKGITDDKGNVKKLSKEKALSNISNPKSLQQLLFPVFDDEALKVAVDEKRLLSEAGVDCAGCATGIIAFTPERAVELTEAGKKVILVRKETSPEDIAGMDAAVGILTSTGGRTSHAAIVAMGMGKPAVVGCSDLSVNEKAGILKTASGQIFKEGDQISIDGNTGKVYKGEIATIEPKITDELKTVIKWSKEIKSLGLRVNADTPNDALKAVELGAEGIGLVRSEHMFFDKTRLPFMQEMILAETDEQKKDTLAKLLPMQREDFYGIYKAMGERPVTVRLLDPPLNEFLPKKEDILKSGKSEEEIADILKRMDALHEANPMLGTRGCRLGIMRPDIPAMQARAVFEAACKAHNEGINVKPEIMVPNVAFAKEFADQKKIIDDVAKQVFKEQGVTVEYKVGTMVETPAAALAADELVKAGAEFFSFGTNDLTQATLLAGRDETAKLFKLYQEKGIIQTSPFDTVDDRVAKLIKYAVKTGKEEAAKQGKDLKVGICGEHGGDPASIKVCHDVGLSYVSCSTLRLPTAVVSAAQAEIKSPKKAQAATA